MMNTPVYRVGQGFDAHALVENRPLILGGVLIPHTHGAEGHSDGDALLHAIADALLGAACLGDLGQYFPSDHQTPKGIDSRIILRRVRESVVNTGFKLGNVDSTIIAQAPHLATHLNTMRAYISEDLLLPLNAVSVKAKSTDHLGFLGRKEGIAALASVMLIVQ